MPHQLCCMRAAGPPPLAAARPHLPAVRSQPAAHLPQLQRVVHAPQLQRHPGEGAVTAAQVREVYHLRLVDRNREAEAAR